MLDTSQPDPSIFHSFSLAPHWSCTFAPHSMVHKRIQGWSVNGVFLDLPARKGNNPQHSHISLPWRRGGWIAAFSKQGNTTTLHQSQQSDDKARPSKQDTGGPSHNKHMHTWAPLLLRACHSPKLSSRSVVPRRLGRQRAWLVANLSGTEKADFPTRAHPAGSPLRSGGRVACMCGFRPALPHLGSRYNWPTRTPAPFPPSVFVIGPHSLST